MARRTHRLLSVIALVSVALAGALDALTGSCAGLAHAVPFALLLAPLLIGRYVGEHRLAQLIGGAVPPTRRRAVPRRAVRTHARILPRGGRLIAHSLAVRPPPACAPAPA